MLQMQLLQFLMVCWGIVLYCSVTFVCATGQNPNSHNYIYSTNYRPKTNYQIVIDCGSTGSRVYIYRYLVASPLSSMQEVANKRVRPALSTFYGNYSGLVEHITSLTTYAERKVAKKYWPYTPISLKATAGLRMMDVKEQEWLIGNIREILEKTNFSFNPLETKVITGAEEALFGLLASNIAYMNVSNKLELKVAAADLGGSSTQIAFALPPKMTVSLNSLSQLSWSELWNNLWRSYPRTCTADFVLQLPGSNERINIFARSVSKLGIVDAMEDTLHTMVNEWNHQSSLEMISSATTSSNHRFPLCPVTDSGRKCIDFQRFSYFDLLQIGEPIGYLENPCVPPGERYPYSEDISDYPWLGTGDFDQCAAFVRQMVMEKAHDEMQCMRGMKPPAIIAMDNFPKVLEVMNLLKDMEKDVGETDTIGGAMTVEAGISPAVIKEVGRKICRKPWPQILKERPDLLPWRAHQVCFGSSFLYVLATELYGVQENDPTSFIPVEDHRHLTLGWPLGVALYFATNLTYEITAKSSSLSI